LYQGAWLLVGTMLVALIRGGFGVPWTTAAAFGLPLGLIAAPMSLSAWYLSRALPLGRIPFGRVAIASSAAALTMGALWSGAGLWWWHTLGRLGLTDERVTTSALFTMVMALGTLTYLVVLSTQYMQAAAEESADAQRRVLESQVAQRDAELMALRAQVDPHFLFNSLNSISGLIGPDPEKARQMCQSLAEFLRDCL